MLLFTKQFENFTGGAWLGVALAAAREAFAMGTFEPLFNTLLLFTVNSFVFEYWKTIDPMADG